MEDVISQTRESGDRNLSSHWTARVSPVRRLQSPSCIQQEEEDRPSPKEKATECKCCASLKSSRNPPRPLSLGYRVDRLRKQPPAPGRDPTLSKAKVTQ